MTSSIARRLALSLIAAPILCSLHAGRLDAQPEPAEPLASVPFELLGGHLFIQLEVNQHREPLSFVFDTGASAAVLDTQIAKQLGIQARRTLNATGANGNQTYHIATRQKLTVTDDVKVSSTSLVLVDLSDFSAGHGKPVAGIIGNDLLRKYAVHIDYDSQQLHFFRFGSPYKTDGYKPIQFEFKNGTPIPVIEASFRLPNGDLFSGDVLVDSGAATSMIVNTPFASKNQLLEKAGKHYSRTAKGLNTSSSYHVIPIDRLSVGQHQFADLELELATTKNGVSGSNRYMGILGNQILKRFDMIVDYSEHLLYLKPNQNFGKKFDFNLSGLRLVIRNGQITVFEVIPGSAAEKLGIQTNDRLISIDGKPCQDINKTRTWLQRPSTRVSLLVEHSNGEQLAVELPLRRLFH